METVYELIATDMAAAFTEWERRYRDEPETFMQDVHRFTETTPETYGEACVSTFLGYIDETSAGYAQRNEARPL